MIYAYSRSLLAQLQGGNLNSWKRYRKVSTIVTRFSDSQLPWLSMPDEKNDEEL